MKRLFRIFPVAVLAVLMITSCEKESSTSSNPGSMDFTSETIDNTSWQGPYNTYITSPHGTSYPMVME